MDDNNVVSPWVEYELQSAIEERVGAGEKKSEFRVFVDNTLKNDIHDSVKIYGRTDGDQGESIEISYGKKMLVHVTAKEVYLYRVGSTGGQKVRVFFL